MWTETHKVQWLIAPTLSCASQNITVIFVHECTNLNVIQKNSIQIYSVVCCAEKNTAPADGKCGMFSPCKKFLGHKHSHNTLHLDCCVQRQI